MNLPNAAVGDLIKQQIELAVPEVAAIKTDEEKIAYLSAMGFKVTHVYPVIGQDFYLITKHGKPVTSFSIRKIFQS